MINIEYNRTLDGEYMTGTLANSRWERLAEFFHSTFSGGMNLVVIAVLRLRCLLQDSKALHRMCKGIRPNVVEADPARKREPIDAIKAKQGKAETTVTVWEEPSPGSS